VTDPMSKGGLLTHVALIVRDLDEIEHLYGRILGVSPQGRTALHEEGVRVSFLPLGSVRVELLEPRSASGALARFLEARGGGIHHLAFEVHDLEEALARARTRGLRMISPGPRRGAEGSRVAFLHPREAHGVLIELVERQEGKPS
jgi:methylmalonyl-CoA/ethylmalonyl-CoA epimerase